MLFDQSFLCVIFFQFFVITINCNSLIVKTKSGCVKGIKQRTYFLNRPYISFRGIPYAEPPIGDLRYKVIISNLKKPK